MAIRPAPKSWATPVPWSCRGEGLTLCLTTRSAMNWSASIARGLSSVLLVISLSKSSPPYPHTAMDGVLRLSATAAPKTACSGEAPGLVRLRAAERKSFHVQVGAFQLDVGRGRPAWANRSRLTNMAEGLLSSGSAHSALRSLYWLMLLG